MYEHLQSSIDNRQENFFYRNLFTYKKSFLHFDGET